MGEVRRAACAVCGIATVGLLSVLLLGCAARKPSPQLIAELGKARTLVAEGCYRCLQEALSTYERLAAAPNAPPDAARGAFEAAFLLFARSKELGLPEEPARARAEALGSRLPPSPTALPPSAYFDALALITGEASGLDPGEREARGRARRLVWPSDGTTPPARLTLTPALSTDLIAQYVALSVDCDDARLRKEVRADEVLARFGFTLMRFRLTLCGFGTASFESFREADPRWVDTYFFEGRREILRRSPTPDVSKAADRFDSAHEAFPESTAITLALGNARNALSEYDVALSLFDSVLAPSPTHRDALLGRILSLSYLSRHYEAIAGATRMIELGTYHQGDAYYWRAWNRYNVHELPAAWDDVERAGKLMVNTSVYTLAGFIAYARHELDTAIDRLDRAYRLDNTNCEAVWTESLVHVDKEAFTPAAPKFGTAVKCFAAAAEQARREIAETQQAELAENVRARRIAAAQKRIDTSEHRRAQAAFNAASCYARLGQKGEATSFIELAAEHPLMKDKAAALKASIDKLPE